jgi:hypothetical protein
MKHSLPLAVGSASTSAALLFLPEGHSLTIPGLVSNSYNGVSTVQRVINTPVSARA